MLTRTFASLGKDNRGTLQAKGRGSEGVPAGFWLSTQCESTPLLASPFPRVWVLFRSALPS